MRWKKLGGFGGEEEREDIDVTQQQDSGPVSSFPSYSEDSLLFFLLIKTIFIVFNEFPLNVFLRQNFTFPVAADQMIQQVWLR